MKRRIIATIYVQEVENGFILEAGPDARAMSKFIFKTYDEVTEAVHEYMKAVSASIREESDNK